MFSNTLRYLRDSQPVPPFQGSILDGILSHGLRPGLGCSAPSGLRSQSRAAAAQDSPGREPWEEGKVVTEP